jgi:PQQ-dependent catabolism-associated beta-propeller protein
MQWRLQTCMILWSLVVTQPAFAYDIYVTNERDNTISVIDGKSLDITRTFAVGRRPRGVFSMDGTKLFVCASDSNAVQVIDPVSGALLHDLPSGEDPEQFALAPNGRTLFVANENNATTTVIDAETRKVLAQIDVGIEPEGMAVSPDGAAAVTTSETTNMVHWIDVATLSAGDATPVGQRPRDAAYSADGAQLWVSSEVGGTVAVLDAKSHAVLKTIDFAIPGISHDRIQPVGISLTKDGRLAFVALGPADRIAAIDTKTFEIKAFILVGRRVWHLALSPAEDFLYTTNGVSGDVTVIDVARLKPIKSIKVGRFPWGVAIRPEPSNIGPTKAGSAP